MRNIVENKKILAMIFFLVFSAIFALVVHSVSYVELIVHSLIDGCLVIVVYLIWRDQDRCCTNLKRTNDDLVVAQTKVAIARKIEGVINNMLQTSFAGKRENEQFQEILMTILSFPWGTSVGKGSIFIVSQANPSELVLMAQHGLHEELLVLCAKVPFGRCLCGKAAGSKEIVFASCIDDRHDITFEKMAPHGHYCVPIMLGGELLGVLNIYVGHGYARTIDEDNLLERVAMNLALLISRWQIVKRLENLANHDSLTGLLNRRAFYLALSQELFRAQRNSYKIAVLYLDLDRFKHVNDTYGHDVGDILLKAFVERVSGVIRASDLFGRLGGDEFVVALIGVSQVQIENRARAILLSLIKDLCISGDVCMRLRTSIGIAVFPHDGGDVEALLNNADVAMYAAKEESRDPDIFTRYPNGRFRFYNDQMREEEIKREALRVELQEAIGSLASEDRRDWQFIPYFQPILDSSRRVVGAEALIRWQHPKKGLLTPGEWMSFAEESEMIVEIGSWMTDRVCEQLGYWKANPLFQVLYLTVNVSIRQTRGDFINVVESALDRNGIKHNSLVVELVETMPGDNSDFAKLRLLSAVGTRIAIDDFGSGYNSMDRVASRIFSILKLDRKFIENLPDNFYFVRAVVNFIHDLGDKVVAEGVETEEQFLLLAQMNCDSYQGYYFSRPLPIDEFEMYVASQNH